MRPRADLVRGLAEELRPVRRAPSSLAFTLLWLVGTWVFVTTVTLATGDLRPGALAQLASSPRFALEILLGLAAGIFAIQAAVELGVPDPTHPGRRAALGLLLMASWVGAHLYGLANPALEPSMLGKREGCSFEVLAFALPPAAAAVWMIRQAFPLARVWTGAMAGAAAAAVPGLFMQLACMYDPAHILTHHLAPIGVVAALGGLLGVLVLRRL